MVLLHRILRAFEGYQKIEEVRIQKRMSHLPKKNFLHTGTRTPHPKDSIAHPSGSNETNYGVT